VSEWFLEEERKKNRKTSVGWMVEEKRFRYPIEVRNNKFTALPSLLVLYCRDPTEAHLIPEATTVMLRFFWDDAAKVSLLTLL
jgi:hypothetical protein